MEEIKKMIDVLKAFDEGRIIQMKIKGSNNGWLDVSPLYTNFDFVHVEYRIKPVMNIRPYKSMQEFLNAQKEHGPYLCNLNDTTMFIPLSITNRTIMYSTFNNCHEVTYIDLIERFKWQDGTPCMICEEEK